MERDGKLLWEVDLPGEKYKGVRPKVATCCQSSQPQMTAQMAMAIMSMSR